MKRILALILLAFVMAPVMKPASAEAGWRHSKGKYAKRHTYRRHHHGRRYSKRHRGQVRGYVARRGGYSYEANDVANTTGDSRTRYGSVNSYRDPFSDRQTVAGPFDHGWFFDSAVAPRGGDSPYMQ